MWVLTDLRGFISDFQKRLFGWKFHFLEMFGVSLKNFRGILEFIFRKYCHMGWIWILRENIEINYDHEKTIAGKSKKIDKLLSFLFCFKCEISCNFSNKLHWPSFHYDRNMLLIYDYFSINQIEMIIFFKFKNFKSYLASDCETLYHVHQTNIDIEKLIKVMICCSSPA